MPRHRTSLTRWFRGRRSVGPVSAPAPPVNVRLVYADDTVVPVDCVYTGLNAEGLHQWDVINRRAEMPRDMLVEMLPPRTSIALAGSPPR